ncbi:hypothetical protein DFJ43DRAFT_1140018 [Lentinula guzmanii]|uniref:Uncharacterized protein n=1 Tax=Lentinula guzmanii TaxID=2804957 RepID=A0AA38JEV1_9AGAR|nr:hypothetical protein DFJ43DRAFT_1140018 [Lentinula guzmanii]
MYKCPSTPTYEGFEDEIFQTPTPWAEFPTCLCSKHSRVIFWSYCSSYSSCSLCPNVLLTGNEAVPVGSDGPQTSKTMESDGLSIGNLGSDSVGRKGTDLEDFEEESEPEIQDNDMATET